MATNRPPADVSTPELFQRAGQFPAAERGDLPLSDEARQFYRSGPPFLQRYLPFWLAVLVSRLLLLLIPVIAIAYPLLRFVPNLYGWSVMRRVFRIYAELMLIEAELESGGGTAGRNMQARLAQLEQSANHLRVPVSFAQPLYHLRAHIELVRNRAARQSHPDTIAEPVATESSAVV